MEISTETQSLLERWKACENGRYPVMAVLPKSYNRLSQKAISQFAELRGASILDGKEAYAGKLNQFKPWGQLQAEIMDWARQRLTAAYNLEAFFNKWKPEERLRFLRALLRQDGHQGLVLLLYCRETDLRTIREIPENSRGVLWTP